MSDDQHPKISHLRGELQIAFMFLQHQNGQKPEIFPIHRTWEPPKVGIKDQIISLETAHRLRNQRRRAGELKAAGDHQVRLLEQSGIPVMEVQPLPLVPNSQPADTPLYNKLRAAFWRAVKRYVPGFEERRIPRSSAQSNPKRDI